MGKLYVIWLVKIYCLVLMYTFVESRVYAATGKLRGWTFYQSGFGYRKKMSFQISVWFAPDCIQVSVRLRYNSCRSGNNKNTKRRRTRPTSRSINMNESPLSAAGRRSSMRRQR